MELVIVTIVKKNENLIHNRDRERNRDDHNGRICRDLDANICYALWWVSQGKAQKCIYDLLTTFFLRTRKYIFEWCWWQVNILWPKFKKVLFWRLNKANLSKTKQYLVIVTLVPFCICFHSNLNSTISQKLEIRILKVYSQYFSFWLILLIIFDN